MRNYRQFYALLNRMPGAMEGLKEELVSQFTNGRTTSLKEMQEWEYNRMCASLRNSNTAMSETALKTEIKKRRSAVLHRMQRLGVDTTNWSNVDHFCLQPRIAGKRFVKLTIEDLAELIPKLESMLQKKEKDKMNFPYELLRFDTVKLN